MRFLLTVALLVLSSAALAAPGPTFVSQMNVDSPLYEAPVKSAAETHPFSVEGVRNSISAVIPIDGCGALTSTVESKYQPNVMDGGQSAFVTLTISNATRANPKACETEALAQVPAVNVDVPIQAGTSKLQIRHPQMRHTEYEVTVTYTPQVDGA